MERWLKSEPVTLKFSENQIDAENGIIRDVVMAQVGPAKGHGYWLEQGFIDQLITYDQKYYNETGLKARFGHPAMSDTTMGRQMGYFHNFRIREGDAIADLHLLKSADLSPSMPNMREWMLSMAQEAKDFVMSSIVFRTFSFYQYDPEDNQRVDLETDSWGDPRPKFKKERVYVDFDEQKGSKHLYTDIVEAGAATNSLFSQQFNQDKFAVRVVEFLQSNQDILSFIRANPHKITEMCESLNIPIEMNSKTKKIGLFKELKAMFFSDVENDEVVEETTGDVIEETPEEDVVAEETVSLSRFTELQNRLNEVEELRQQFQARIEELEKRPLAAPATYEEDPGPGKGAEEFMCATTLRAMGRRKKA